MFPANLVQATFQQVRHDAARSDTKPAAFKRKLNASFICFCFFVFVFFMGNSIEQVASTLWSPNQQWVSRSPPRGERSSTGSRTITELTSRTSPSIWRHLLMCSYALVKGRVTEWTSSELLYFLPPWVKKKKRNYSSRHIVANENAFKDCAVNVCRYYAGEDGAKRQRAGELLPEPEWSRPSDCCHCYMVMTSFKQAVLLLELIHGFHLYKSYEHSGYDFKICLTQMYSRYIV